METITKIWCRVAGNPRLCLLNDKKREEMVVSRRENYIVRVVHSNGQQKAKNIYHT